MKSVLLLINTTTVFLDFNYELYFSSSNNKKKLLSLLYFMNILKTKIYDM